MEQVILQLQSLIVRMEQVVETGTAAGLGPVAGVAALTAMRACLQQYEGQWAVSIRIEPMESGGDPGRSAQPHPSLYN